MHEKNKAHLTTWIEVKQFFSHSCEMGSIAFLGVNYLFFIILSLYTIEYILLGTWMQKCQKQIRGVPKSSIIFERILSEILTKSVDMYSLSKSRIFFQSSAQIKSYIAQIIYFNRELGTGCAKLLPCFCKF